MTKLRVLHFPTDVGGHPSALSRGEREAGACSEVAVLHRSWLGYPVDIDLRAKAGSKVSDLMARVRFMMKASRRYDVFHFNFGQSFLPGMRDLPWLRRMGKRVFVTFQGCDARQKSVCAQLELSCCGDQDGEGLCTADRDAHKRRLIERACHHAHRVFALNPDLLRVIPDGEFLPYAIDWPREEPVQRPLAGRSLRICHAPTNRTIKGTDNILAALDALSGEFEFELDLIENVPHAEAMQRYQNADLVIDQLRVGWYGAFAVELMAMGKPVVAYIRESDLAHVPPQLAEDLPIVNATPASIETVLRGLLSTPEQMAEIGRRSRRFVERWHDPERIAARLLEVYTDPSEPFSGKATASSSTG